MVILTYATLWLDLEDITLSGIMWTRRWKCSAAVGITGVDKMQRQWLLDTERGDIAEFMFNGHTLLSFTEWESHHPATGEAEAAGRPADWRLVGYRRSSSPVWLTECVSQKKKAKPGWQDGPPCKGACSLIPGAYVIKGEN